MSSNKDEVLLRKAGPEDFKLILNQWLGREWRDSPYAGCLPNDQFKRFYAEAIRQLLARGATVVVACNPSKPDHLLGWICYEHTPRDRILHYVFVRPMYRSNGLCRSLMDEVGFPRGSTYVYTFRTRDSNRLLSGGTHLPALARRKNAFKPDVEGAPEGELN